MLINETILSDSSKNRLDIAILKMKENPSFKMETKSHNDITFSPESNLVLSKTRAKNILDYCVSRGVDEKRITSVGLGDKFPIIICDDGNCIPAELELNRRIEFTLGK